MYTILTPLHDVLLHLEGARLEVGPVEVVITEEHSHDLEVWVVTRSRELIKLDGGQAYIVQLLHVLAMGLKTAAIATSKQCVKLLSSEGRQEPLEVERILFGFIYRPALCRLIVIFALMSKVSFPNFATILIFVIIFTICGHFIIRLLLFDLISFAIVTHRLDFLLLTQLFIVFFVIRWERGSESHFLLMLFYRILLSLVCLHLEIARLTSILSHTLLTTEGLLNIDMLATGARSFALSEAPCQIV